MNRRRYLRATLTLGLSICASLVSWPTSAQEPEEGVSIEEMFDWTLGPQPVAITSLAQLHLPDGYRYLGATDTKTLMELMENPTSSDEYFMSPEDMRWFAIFSYDDTGHIEDDEEIDADSVLDSFREGTELANQERARRGWAELHIIGWEYPPFYENDSQRLAWAIRAESEGDPVINYNTRLLSRTGVMSATLVADPEILDTAVQEFQAALDGFAFNAGQRYAEFRPGDKVAAYGLTALVAGGAAAAVAKTGLGKGLFKFIGAGIVALLAAAGTFFRRLFGRRD